MSIVEKLNQSLGFEIRDQKLFETAFTHRSYINEHPDYDNNSNERLEFLGDAVLQFLSSKFLYYNFPNFPEGDLTNLRASMVKTTSLGEEAKRLGFGELLLMSKGEEMTGGRIREYLLANTFESFLGALCIEKGIEACEKFLDQNLFYKAKKFVEEDSYKDAKTIFQEKVQELKKVTPTYKIIETSGPEHNKTFVVGVYIGGEEFAVGEGNSKQKAEQEAAKKGLNKLT
jgi:ribonuclease-3